MVVDYNCILMRDGLEIEHKRRMSKLRFKEKNNVLKQKLFFFFALFKICLKLSCTIT